MYRFSINSNMRSKLVGLRRIILVFIGIFHVTRMIPGIFLFFTRTRMYDKCILVHCTKYEAAGWSLVLLLLSGVRADPKYSYSYTCLLYTSDAADE